MANLEKFVGGVPAGILFKLDMNDLKEIVENSVDDDVFNKEAELGLIALVCYFEAYFKNQFAAIINICPSIVANLINRRPEIAIELKDLFLLDFNISSHIVFMAE